LADCYATSQAFVASTVAVAVVVTALTIGMNLPGRGAGQPGEAKDADEALDAAGGGAGGAVTRAVTRSTPGVGDPTVRFGDLAAGAKRMVRDMARTASAELGSGGRLEDIRSASAYLGREIGVAQSQTTGSLRAALGTETGLMSSMRRADEAWLLHTHPVYVSEPGHFALDIRTATSRVEAVVDWGGNVTHFNNTGILAQPPVSPINAAGYVVGY
jgi:hypothetical protein